MPQLFQRGVAAALDARYHLVFSGTEQREVTVEIRRRVPTIADGLHGRPDLRLDADATTWVRFLGGRASLPWALARRRFRLKGSPRLLAAFARCFPT
jgi:hypothetical protein